MEAYRTIADTNLLSEVCEILKPYPDALEFVILYRDYIHGIDDIVDGDISGHEKILEVFALGARLFSSDFYAHNRQFLYPIETMINNTYADSCEWENSVEKWKIRDSSVLRHAGIDMFLFVIRLVAGRDAMRKISSKFRTQCHEFHMDKETNAI